jgi:hypothetical protein
VSNNDEEEDAAYAYFPAFAPLAFDPSAAPAAAAAAAAACSKRQLLKDSERWGDI